MTLDYSHVVSCLNTDVLPEGSGGPKLLCIDDDPNISEAFARRFHRYGIEVERAYHGMHGYWLAVTSKPDVIITDLRMPLGEGEYVVQCLERNAETAHIPVIVLTGFKETGLAEHLRGLGGGARVHEAGPV